MSLLTIVQNAALRFGIQQPNIAASSTDQNIQQLVAFVNEDGQELASRFAWQQLTKEASFTTVAAETQGALSTITGPDFAFILNETIWNRTQRRPVFGPKSPAEWQQLKAQFNQGPWQQYRIRGNSILFIPAPPAGQWCYFEWVSNYWCTDSTGVTGRTAMIADTDVSLLNERLLTLGAIWRFKQAKGLPYDEDYDKCERAITDEMDRNASKAKLSLAGNMGDFFPGVFVSAGNWTMP